jgi:oligopeptide transport system permease protein
MQDINIDINSLFTAATEQEKQSIQTIMHKPKTYRQDAFERFKKNKVAVVSAVFIIIIAAFAIIGPFLSHYSFDQQIKGSEYIPPFQSFMHPLGTDCLGRDNFVRLMVGTRISLSIGVLTSIMVVIIGCIYGAAAGFFGGLTDSIMMRIVDIFYSIPTMLIIILLQVVLMQPLNNFFSSHPALRTIDPGLLSIFITLSLLYWMDMARMVRGQILSLRQAEFVNAAKALGASPWRIIKNHLLPNCAGVIIVTAMLNVPTAIFTEAFLSFIGLGVAAPMASLGSLASDALDGIYSYPYMLIFPSVLISLIILSFNLVGDGLRDALDPRMKSKA